MDRRDMDLMEFDSIKTELENIYGRRIEYARDCAIISGLIEQKTGRLVSSATLRRLFGLLKTQSTPSKYTIDTLKKYIEGSKIAGNINPELSRRLSKTEDACNLLIEECGGINEKLVKFLFESNYVSNIFFDYAIYLLKRSVKEHNTEFINAFYSQKGYIIDQFRFVRVLGIALKQEPKFCKKFIKEFAKNPNARLYFFERFVDVGSFESYKYWLQEYLKHESDPLKKLWATSILKWGHFMSGIPFEWNKFKNQLTENREELIKSHPLVLARILGLSLLNDDLVTEACQKINEVLSGEKDDLQNDGYHTPYFSILILQYLIVSKQTQLLNQVRNNFEIYHSVKHEQLDGTIPFSIKLIDSIINKQDNFDFNEIIAFRSGFTNEDLILKTMASRYLKNNNDNSDKDFVEGLTKKSGFIKLNDLKKLEFSS